MISSRTVHFSLHSDLQDSVTAFTRKMPLLAFLNVPRIWFERSICYTFPHIRSHLQTIRVGILECSTLGAQVSRNNDWVSNKNKQKIRRLRNWFSHYLRLEMPLSEWEMIPLGFSFLFFVCVWPNFNNGTLLSGLSRKTEFAGKNLVQRVCFITSEEKGLLLKRVELWKTNAGGILPPPPYTHTHTRRLTHSHT